MQEELKEWINEEQYHELISGVNNCPHKLLGIHNIKDGKGVLVYRPHAEEVMIQNEESGEMEKLDKIGEDGFFGKYLSDSQIKKYKLFIKYGENDVVETYDPYSFEPLIGELDIHLFAEGTHEKIYDKLGAHPIEYNGVKGTYFAIWAPHARNVSVVGDFNMWDSRLHPMGILDTSGIYELFIPGVEPGAIYKYFIRTRDGEELFKSDPYGNYAEIRPNNASVVVDLEHFKWSDYKWQREKRMLSRVDMLKKPVSIYELHPGSWRKHDDWTEDGFYNYRELAEQLADYLLDMNYTHVELMGIAEHPFDGSWGYQVVGYYAPTSRYGTPEDFMYFVDYMHAKGISVILDWVPAHFPKDAHGLGRFDGEPLYEYPDKRMGEHPHWGTYIFNYGMNQVENFLIANALFWINKFHIDGLRVDAVASMLYLDYGKNDGEWLPNKNGGKENLDAIHLMKHLNEIIGEKYQSTLLVAEESTSWAGVTSPVSMGGLGFIYKWNMGWMNDFLEYMKVDPFFRKFNHEKLIFSLKYAKSENFIQVLSHDEVVYGKCSMINKMPGEEREKFANLRLAYGFMYGHPGKKLLFMGQEFAQCNEWNEKKELDWELLGEKKHQHMRNYVKKLNHLYQSYSAMYYNDYDDIGFEWIDCSNAETSVISFMRRGKTVKDQLLFVCNFTPVERKEFKVGVPCMTSYSLILNSDAEEFGGSGVNVPRVLKSTKASCNERNYSITFDLPPLSVVAFSFEYGKGRRKTRRKNK